MGDLSKNFSRSEFACRCGCGFDTPSPAIVRTVQTIRDEAGRAVTINSGCRCPRHNARQKNSVPDSAHITGEAADIYIEGWTNKKLGALIKKLHSQGKLPSLRYCYLIKGSRRAVHVGTDNKPRKRIFAF